MKVDILAFAAHPDDIELSAAGTILKHISMGKTVAIVDLTQGELGSRGSSETRYAEAANATQILGISYRVNLKMADGFFEINEQNKRLIIEQIRRFQPTIVLANAINDRHPDHGRAAKLVSDSCFLAGLRKVETTWEGEKQTAHRPKAVFNYIQDDFITPDFVIDVTAFAEKKLESILAYKTQFYDPESKEPETPISSAAFLEFIKGRMMHFGRPIGAQYAEGFTIERDMNVKSLFDIL
jgi:bacillithiol biosynthesis deacetylase BshB1